MSTNKMIWVTDAVNKTKVAINPRHVVVVFVAPEGSEHTGKTVLNLINGQIIVEESDIDVVAGLAG